MKLSLSQSKFPFYARYKLIILSLLFAFAGIRAVAFTPANVNLVTAISMPFLEVAGLLLAYKITLFASQKLFVLSKWAYQTTQKYCKKNNIDLNPINKIPYAHHLIHKLTALLYAQQDKLSSLPLFGNLFAKKPPLSPEQEQPGTNQASKELGGTEQQKPMDSQQKPDKTRDPQEEKAALAPTPLSPHERDKPTERAQEPSNREHREPVKTRSNDLQRDQAQLPSNGAVKKRTSKKKKSARNKKAPREQLNQRLAASSQALQEMPENETNGEPAAALVQPTVLTFRPGRKKANASTGAARTSPYQGKKSKAESLAPQQKTRHKKNHSKALA